MSSALIKQKAKAALKAIPASLVTALVADDLIQGLRLKTGRIGSGSGSTHIYRSEAESLTYVEEVFKDYKKYGGIEKFFGVVAEIGPGDNAGVAMLMRGEGCTQVDLIDRYFSYRDPEQQKKIYEALAQKYHLEDLCTDNNWDEKALVGINWKIGQAAEVYFQKYAQEHRVAYDFIVSRAVLEHLYDPLDALCQMVACLKPGGQMFHKIDLRDHSMFTPIHHELTFLEVSENIYPLMVKNSGRPNRILTHRYRDILDSMKKRGIIDYSILITHLVEVGEIIPHQEFDKIDIDKRRQAISFVEQHRHNFTKEFSQVDSKDLATAGVFIIVTKNID